MYILIIKILYGFSYYIRLVIIGSIDEFNFKIITVIIYVISAFVLLFFLEIIEIDCCGLNKNTNINIIKRVKESNIRDSIIDEGVIDNTNIGSLGTDSSRDDSNLINTSNLHDNNLSNTFSS